MLEGDKVTFVKILLIMGECSAIFFCFCSQNELSRFQAVFSFFLSYFLALILLEKLSEHVFFSLFFLCLVVEFILVEYNFSFPFFLFCRTFSIFVYLPGDLVVGVRFGCSASIPVSAPLFLPKIFPQKKKGP